MRSLLKAAIGTALGLLALTAPASAQFLTFVSAAGNDANTCFVQAAPCKTLQRAINQTSAGGEVRLLTSLTSNGFINKSITVEGGYNTVIGTIAVNSASAIVRFRRLNLNGRHAFPTGFNLINAAAVHIEESSAERYTGNGIVSSAGAPMELVVSNSVSRDNQKGINVNSATTKAVIENSRFENNSFSGVEVSFGQISLARSITWGNFSGVFNVGGGATVNVVDTVAAANGDIGFALGSTTGGEDMTLESCDAHNNANQGVFVSANTTARISNCTITANEDHGILNSGTALTRGNNLIAGNNPNTSGTITPLPGE